MLPKNDVALSQKANSVKILFVTNELPRLDGGGQTVRDFQLLSHLNKKYRFTVVCFNDSHLEESIEALQAADIHVEIVPRPRYDPATIWHRRWDTVVDLFQPLPRFVYSITPENLRRQVEFVIKRENPSLVHIAHTEMARLVPSDKMIRRVIGTDAATLKTARSIALLSKPTYRLWRKIEILKMARYERQVIHQADLYIVASEREAQWARQQVPQSRVAVIPNGVDVRYFQPFPAVESNIPTLLFVGTLSYEPNADAVLWFYKDIYPRIKSQMPKARLVIVGREPPPAVQALAQCPGITVTGFVEDIRLYLARSSVVIVPLRNGGGTRLKILEALAMEKAVVSTTIGAEGLDLTPGEHLEVADTPAEFADAVVGLLGDVGRRLRIGSAGRALVEREYTWNKIATRLDIAYQQVIPVGS